MYSSDYSRRYGHYGTKLNSEAKSWLIPAIAVGGVIGALLSSIISYRYEKHREGHIPLGFSEISEIEREAEKDGETVSSTTFLLAGTNDLCMKLFESNNRAHLEKGDFTDNFVSELKSRMHEKHYHYEIPDYLKKLPANVAEVLGLYEPYTLVGGGLFPINQAFDQSWSEFHFDHYHSETYLDTETYSCGNNQTCTRTVTRTRQVYDYTTHSYTYHSAEGEKAARLLESLLEQYEELKFTDQLKFASKTNTKGEEAAKSSRENEKLGEKELLEIAQRWYSGSTLRLGLEEIAVLWENIHQDNNAWAAAKETATSTTYITYSRIDSGPHAYRVATKALRDGKALRENITQIHEGLKFIQESLPTLESKITTLINDSSIKESDKLEKQAEEIVALAQKMYTLNFKGGFDVAGFRGYMIFVMGFLGALAGAGLGFGAGRLIDGRRGAREETNYS